MTRFRLSISLLAIVVHVSLVGGTSAQESDQNSTRLARLVWQDYETKTLKWGDLRNNGEKLQLRMGGDVQGFPKLDAKRQELVQMDRVARTALVGVRDDAGGAFSSGWVCVDLGVERQGSEWRYPSKPRTTCSAVSDSQGNPAHLYVYDDAFYLANDSLNGFTRLEPALLAKSGTNYRGTFHRGGGGHITLAAVGEKVTYSTWIPGEGPQKGRVDVVDLNEPFDRSIAYSFFLPIGGLHGATANSGKVFFAPSDGIYWIEADAELQRSADDVQARHLSLGTDSSTKRPYRTGAFTNHETWTLFTTGRGESASLCLLDASAGEPAVVKLSLPTEEGLSLVTPETVVTETGKRYAFVFQDRAQGNSEEKLTVVDLDPNGDGDLVDAAAVKTLEAGASKVSGHYGHHSIAFDDAGRYGFIANPGDGQIWLLSLTDLEVVRRYEVGGSPSKILAIGGAEAERR